MPVYLDQVADYDLEKLKDSLRQALIALDLNLKGKKSAFIKPNIVVPAKPSSAIIAHPALARALIEVLQENGIKDITIGEGAGVGQDPQAAFRVSGYQKLAQDLGVKLVDLNQAQRRQLKWKFGTLALPEIAFTADLYINLAKLKTHGQSMVTLAIKNQKGLLLPQDKKNFHVKWGLAEPIVELAKLVKPQLNIIDGIEAMEGDGPIGGKKKKTNLVIYSDDLLEADLAGVEIMGMDPQEIDYLQYALQQKLGSPKPRLLGVPVEQLATKFQPANQTYTNRLGIYSWRSPWVCSMCLQNFIGAFKMAITNPRYWPKLPKFFYYIFLSRLNLIQGATTQVPDLKGRVLCLGKCTKKRAEAKDYTHVPGCPPTAEDILKRL